MCDSIKKNSQLLIRLPDDVMYKFKIALAVRDITAQAVVQRAIEIFIQDAGVDRMDCLKQDTR
ncbi:MAG: hypothetical protein PHD08_05395 [Synergistaceae bacterium]|jgi:hypothetical protein|nr:hypothetical protein [Synergistaceae bacterium]MDD3672992.1 hypothetical protein [Synergistaceae bacterium]